MRNKDMCRVCMAENTELVQIFSKGSEISYKLSSCFTTVTIHKDDGLPQSICKPCITDLSVVVNFKEKMEKSDSELRLLFKRLPIKSDTLDEGEEKIAEIITVKMEPGLDLEPEDSASDFEDQNLDSLELDLDTDKDKYTNLLYDKTRKCCSNCSKSFQNQEALDEHCRVNQCYVKHFCSICKVPLKTNKALKRHYETGVHLRALGKPVRRKNAAVLEPKYIISEKSGIKAIKTEEEKMVVVGRELKCPLCSKEYSSVSGLRKHINSHKGEKFECQVCHQNFNRRDQLLNHSRKHDENAPKYECDLCQKSYNQKSVLREHMRVHFKDPFAICPFCGRNFSCVSNMKQHILRHTNTKNFECGHCGKKFISKGELQGHERVHTLQKPYVCDICGGCFTMSYSLRKHKRTHTGERPYPCDYCPKRFKILETMKIHRRIHTGEKPYSCKFCARAFTQKNDMVKHERIHTGTREYQCKICDKRFIQASTLATHIKGVHKGQTAPAPSSAPTPQETENQNNAAIAPVPVQPLQNFSQISPYNQTTSPMPMPQ